MPTDANATTHRLPQNNQHASWQRTLPRGRRRTPANHLPPPAAPENEVNREQTLAQIARVVRRRTAKQDVLIQGDWNVDWLPAHQCDPCAQEGRQEKHAEDCVAPHPAHEQTLLAPISKLNAVGAQFALMDYSMATPGIIKASWLAWHPYQTDHALLINEVTPKHRTLSKKHQRT